MLHSFLATNRAVLIERCLAMGAARAQPGGGESKTRYNVPLFLEQLIETLTLEQSCDTVRSRSLSGVSGGGSPSEIADSAMLNGRELLKRGFTLEQVVRQYGDLCQAVTNLAFETHAPIAVAEFRTLNRCLDNATAGAVAEFSSRKTTTAPDEGFSALNSRLGPLAHELRNYLHAAMHAVKAIRTGNVGISGATGAVLDRSLLGMSNLIDRSLAEVRVTAGLPHVLRLFDSPTSWEMSKLLRS